MLRRCIVLVLFFVTIQGIYDPSDEVPEKSTKTVHFHHNYSKVNIQRPVYNTHSYRQRPATAHQEIERLTQNGDLVRIKRNKTKIEIYSKCPKGATGQFVFELSCNQYLNCWKGRDFVQNCAPGTLFNPKNLECDYAEKVQCVTGPRQSMLLHHHEKLTEETQPGCPQGFSRIIPHYTDCSKFINCDRGKENVMDCAPGTLFDVNSNNCDYPQKAQCVNQQGGYIGRGTNVYGQDQVSSNYQQGTYSQNANNNQDSGYGSSQRVRSNYQGSSSDQNQQSSNLDTVSSSGHQGQRYKPVHSVGTDYQSNADGLHHNLQPYEQHLESLSSNYQGRQSQEYRPVHNVRTTYQSASDGFGQAQYDQNLDSYDQNSETSFASSQNTLGNNRQRYKPVYNHQMSSTHNGQGEYDQNLETYDQNVQSSSSSHRIRSPNRQYRPVHNVTTTYLDQGQYDQNLEATPDIDTHRAPQYRPIYTSNTNYEKNYDSSNSNVRRGNLQGQNSESFSSYARGHQINAHRPTHNVKSSYQASSYNNQDQQSSRLNEGVYSQNQQLASTSNVDAGAYQDHQTLSGGQTQSPKCPQDGAGLYAHPYDCSKFLNCANGMTYIQDCAPGTLFNPLLKVCDFPYNVECSNAKSNGDSSTIDSHDQQQHAPSSRPPVNFYTSKRPQTNIYRPEQTFYDQQNRNYQHRPVQNWQESGDNVPYSSTSKPTVSYSSNRPQTNIDRHEQTVYDQQNRNYQHRPAQNWQESGDNVPYSSTRTPVSSHTSNRQQGNIDRYEQTVYNQQNRNFEHRPARQWNRVDDGRDDFNSQSQQSPDREQGVIVQQTLHDGNEQGWIPVEADSSSSSTSKPIGFYVTKPPQNHHTPKPDDFARTYETPEVDYVYEYDDDIIVDAQPASSNNKPQSVVCRGGQYTCPHNKCIPNSAICDGFHDCVDGSDESSCDLDKFASTRNNKLAVAEKKKIANTTAVACAKYCLDEIGFQCRAFNYRKHDGVCYLLDRNIGLSGALIIYSVFDYYEMTSKTINCTNLFQCPNNKCVAYSKLCDGQNDCDDRADEKHCSAHVLGYSVRLTGSPNKNEGRIEVTAMGKTGFICDDNFGMRDAEVVCKELGFDLGALEVKGNSYYAKEIGNNTFYLMDDVGCLGNESSLRDCDFNGWGVHNCMGQEVVGVVCKTPEEKCKEGFWQCDNEQECIPVGFLCDGVYDCTDSSDEEDRHCNAKIQLRLANGSTHFEGRVEVKYLDTWGTICDDDFNEDAAKVVCQYFGFYGSASVRKNGYFGVGKGPIWLDQVFCQGNESSLEECVHWEWGEHNCDHSEDVGVVCSESAYVDGTERRRKEKVVVPPRVEPLQLLPERCGLRKDSIFTQDDEVHFRVVKGSEAKKGDYPWQASIRVKGKSSKPTHWCGAVVISQRFVLTAAHCLQGFSKSAYVVVAGDYHVDENEGSEQLALIEDFFLHEDFRKGQKMNNDIALVKLKGNGFRITDDVQPVCLPDTTTLYQHDMNCTISGFGSTKSGKAFYSHVLRAGWIPLQSRDICKMPHIYGTSITEGMICAGFLDEGVDACDGDSGGPLACLHEGVFTLFGITSWGQHCGYANKPGVYVKVGYYREWIEEKMRKYA